MRSQEEKKLLFLLKVKVKLSILYTPQCRLAGHCESEAGLN